MAIRFTCSCGARLEASEMFGGRRGRCAGCHAPVLVPGPEPEPVRAGCGEALEETGPREAVLVVSREGVAIEGAGAGAGRGPGAGRRGAGAGRGAEEISANEKTAIIPLETMEAEAAADEEEPNLLIEPEPDPPEPAALRGSEVPGAAAANGADPRPRVDRLSRIRLWLDRHPAPSGLAAALMMTAATFSFAVQLGWVASEPAARARPEGRAWYYDLNREALFVGAANLAAPVAVPSDAPGRRSGVRAFVFSCGSCGDPSERFVGWLEKYPPEAREKKKRLNRLLAEGGMTPETTRLEEAVWSARLIATPGAPQAWVRAESEAGRALRAAARQRCDEESVPARCRPDAG